MNQTIKFHGVVVHGRKKGRTIGYPTANVETDEAVADGVYIGKTAVNGKQFQALVFIGKAETFNFQRRTYEVNVIGYTGDEFYGQNLEVELLKKIRDNVRFGSIAELVAQLHKDTASAAEFKQQ